MPCFGCFAWAAPVWARQMVEQPLDQSSRLATASTVLGLDQSVPWAQTPHHVLRLFLTPRVSTQLRDHATILPSRTSNISGGCAATAGAPSNKMTIRGTVRSLAIRKHVLNFTGCFTASGQSIRKWACDKGNTCCIRYEEETDAPSRGGKGGSSSQFPKHSWPGKHGMHGLAQRTLQGCCRTREGLQLAAYRCFMCSTESRSKMRAHLQHWQLTKGCAGLHFRPLLESHPLVLEGDLPKGEHQAGWLTLGCLRACGSSTCGAPLMASMQNNPASVDNHMLARYVHGVGNTGPGIGMEFGIQGPDASKLSSRHVSTFQVVCTRGRSTLTKSKYESFTSLGMVGVLKGILVH
eukprot:1154348-Pelagomonas_calceolata.AAC.1